MKLSWISVFCLCRSAITPDGPLEKRKSLRRIHRPVTPSIGVRSGIWTRKSRRKRLWFTEKLREKGVLQEFTV